MESWLGREDSVPIPDSVIISIDTKHLHIDEDEIERKMTTILRHDEDKLRAIDEEKRRKERAKANEIERRLQREKTEKERRKEERREFEEKKERESRRLHSLPDPDVYPLNAISFHRLHSLSLPSWHPNAVTSQASPPSDSEGLEVSSDIVETREKAEKMIKDVNWEEVKEEGKDLIRRSNRRHLDVVESLCSFFDREMKETRRESLRSFDSLSSWGQRVKVNRLEAFLYLGDDFLSSLSSPSPSSSSSSGARFDGLEDDDDEDRPFLSLSDSDSDSDLHDFNKPFNDR